MSPKQTPLSHEGNNNVHAAEPSTSIAQRAILATLPLSIAVIPWGILTGAIAIQIGLNMVQAQAMSLLVFAGAAQLSAMSLMAAGASSVSLFGSTLVISARHLLYSITFREHVLELPLRWRLAIAMVLTDEMFAVSQTDTLQRGKFSAPFALVSGLTFYVIWNLATLAGIVTGEAFKDLEGLGLDFAIAATFIAMTFDQLRRLPIAAAMLVSAVLAVSLKPFLPEAYIVVAALCGMLTAYLLEGDA